jgi:hypothetical protein
MMDASRLISPYDADPQGPMCEKVSPGTEKAWLPSACEEPPGHGGKHHGQYGESWDDEGNTNLADCIPYYNDDPALPHPLGFHPGPGRPSAWQDDAESG